MLQRNYIYDVTGMIFIVLVSDWLSGGVEGRSMSALDGTIDYLLNLLKKNGSTDYIHSTV